MRTVDAICKMNAECFGEYDDYSFPENVYDEFVKDGLYVITRHKGKPVGYALYFEYAEHIECVRRGVLEEYRGQHFGIRITKRLIARAEQLGKNYWTYAHAGNLPSINSSLKAGMLVYEIDGDWVQLVHHCKKKETHVRE